MVWRCICLCICLSRSPHILQLSSKPSCNGDVVSLVFCSIFWGSIQSGDGKTLPPMVKLLAHRFYIHFSFSFIVPMPIGSDYVKIDFMCSEIYTSGCRIQLSFTKLSMISTNMRDKSFDIVTNKQWSGQTDHGVVLAEFGSVQPSFFFTGKRFYFFKLL